MGRFAIIATLMLVLAACGPGTTTDQPLPTLAQLPTAASVAMTPTTENKGSTGPSDAPTPVQSTAPLVNVNFDGALQGVLTQANLTFELGGLYTLLLEQPDGTENPVQVRILMAPNIEPGTYAIVPDNDFQLPAGHPVAVRFDLGFIPEDISGTFVLDSLGENNYSGSVQLTARSADGTLTVTGQFQNLNAAVIG